MTFFVDRFNGERWVCALAAEHYVNPHSISGPPEGLNGAFPSSVSPGNTTAFSGLPGWLARVRFDDQVMESYEWTKVPVNSADPDSDTAWGWKFLGRNQVNIPAERMSAGELSVM